MKFKRSIVIIAALAIFMGSAATLIYQRLKPKEVKVQGVMGICTEQELILDSDIIIAGTVKNIGDGKWSNPDFKDKNKRNIIQTDIIVGIDDLLSGEYKNKDVTVRIDKGYNKETNTKMISDGYPDFKVGERVILFLVRDDSDLKTDEDYFILVGMKQGKWNITNDKKIENLSVDSNYSFRNATISYLKDKIEQEKTNNPTWKEIRRKQQIEIIENNKKLFGETEIPKHVQKELGIE